MVVQLAYSPVVETVEQRAWNLVERTVVDWAALKVGKKVGKSEIAMADQLGQRMVDE